MGGSLIAAAKAGAVVGTGAHTGTKLLAHHRPLDRRATATRLEEHRRAVARWAGAANEEPVLADPDEIARYFRGVGTSRRCLLRDDGGKC
ncbi:hypothetical protein [Luteitalea pratensis]|uniref:hypothetical protein n=1 Tax=Luteitalea pratensis TaxID=1855912 RepID=UPI0013906386|nr:hypothetical protein [Luteitalea pratensis]